LEIPKIPALTPKPLFQLWERGEEKAENIGKN